MHSRDRKEEMGICKIDQYRKRGRQTRWMDRLKFMKKKCEGVRDAAVGVSDKGKVK